ncbi:M28 family peptidase [Stetteria hydrogenophila]
MPVSRFGPGELREWALRLWRPGPVVAGSREEREAVDAVAGLVEDVLGVRPRRIPVPLTTWRLRGGGVEPRPAWLRVQPYSLDADVEGAAEWVPGDPSEPGSWASYRGSPIAVAGEPGNPDEAKAAALLAWEHGARALVLACRRPRTIVSTGVWGYPYWAGAPPPVPVVCVDEESASRIAGEGRARVWVEAGAVESQGVTLEADLGGSGPLVIVGAHHDKWEGGFLDNTLGVAQAVAAAGILAGRGVRVRLASFTAEEAGAPGFAGWYWSWGSRLYFRELARAGLSGEVAAYINFDLAAGGLVLSGAPQLLASLEGLGGFRVRCCECPECDSFQAAAWAGIPTVSIHSLWSEGVREVYHTPDDEPGRVDWGSAWRAVELAVKAAESAASPRWGALARLYTGILGSGPLRARRILYLIEATAARAGWDRVYRALAPRFLRAVNWGSYRYSTGDLEAVWFPEAECARRILRGEEYDEVIVAGEERLVCAGGRRGALLQLNWALALLEEGVEEALRGLLA